MRRARSGITFLLLVALLALGGTGRAQTNTSADSLSELILYVESTYGVVLRSPLPGDVFNSLELIGHVLGRQMAHIKGNPEREQLITSLRQTYEEGCVLITVIYEQPVARLCIDSMLGMRDANVRTIIERLGGRIPPNPPDLFSFMGWPALATDATPSPTPPPAVTPTPVPTPGPTVPTTPQPTSPLQMVGTDAAGSSLYGQPVCTWEVQLILIDLTNLPTDNNLASPDYGAAIVPAEFENEFHVQLTHVGLNRIAQLSGKDARDVLEAKGYFKKRGDGAWVSTAAYDNFVTYGTQAPRPSPVCAGPQVQVDPSAGGAFVIRGVIKSGSKTRGWDTRANYGVRWEIPNPTGVAVTFTKGEITTWEPKTDGQGRFAGGDYVTREARGFTLPPPGSEKDAYPWFPCVNSSCQGTHTEIYEGQDANGNSVRLILEFNA